MMGTLDAGNESKKYMLNTLIQALSSGVIRHIYMDVKSYNLDLNGEDGHYDDPVRVLNLGEEYIFNIRVAPDPQRIALSSREQLAIRALLTRDNVAWKVLADYLAEENFQERIS